MKLAFNGKAHYPDFKAGYELYKSRARSRECMSERDFNKVIRCYCKYLVNRLKLYGMADLPMGLGSIAAATIRRRPLFMGKMFVGYGKKDWKNGGYDGSHKAFGIVFLPSRKRNANLRSFGFVANRELYKRMKAIYELDYCPWVPFEFNDEMI